MQERIWTASNLLSVSRVLLVAPAVYFLMTDDPHDRLWASAILAVVILTDFLDGYFARRLHQVTELGKIIDPLADKIAVAAVALTLLLTGDIPLWYLLAVVVRDGLIVVGGLMIRKKKHIVLQSNWPGKIAVSVIALYLWLSTLRLEFLEPFRSFTLWASVVMMVLSLAVYSRRLFIGRLLESRGEHGTV